MVLINMHGILFFSENFTKLCVSHVYFIFDFLADGQHLYKSQVSKDLEKYAGHSFKKLRTPSRCRVCDSYVYFNSMECEQVT